MRATLAALAAAALLAGCGGGGGDTDAVKSTIRDYLNAFTSGNGAKACSLMTASTRVQFVQRVQLVTKTTDCGRSLDAIRSTAGPDVTAALKRAELGAVKVKGGRATVQLTASGHQSTASLAKENGEWRVSGVPGTGGG